MAGAGFATQPDYGDCAITGTELAANADYGQNYDDPLPGDDDDVDYEPVAEDYDRVDDDAYEDPPQNRRSSAQNIHRAAGAATIPAEGLYGEIEDDGSAPLPPPKQPPRRLTGQDAARHAKAKARVAEGMKRSEADGMDNEESFYGAAGDEPGRFATASQLPKRTEGSRHSLAYKMFVPTLLPSTCVPFPFARSRKFVVDRLPGPMCAEEMDVDVCHPKDMMIACVVYKLCNSPCFIPQVRRSGVL
jgi:hypothetical protein